MRLDGIRINPFTEALFVKRVDKEENKKEEVLKPDKPVRKSDEDIAVRLSLTQSLLKPKSFEERVREDDPNDPLLKGMTPGMKKAFLAELDGKVVSRGYNSLLTIGGGSGKMVMNNMLEAYAKRYDELVQGHKDGMRSIFITDSQTGELRTLTLEEELQELNENLEKSIECFNGLVDQMPQWIKALERHANSLVESVKKYGGSAALDMAEQAMDHADRLRRDLKTLPERAQERERRMYAAIDEFLAQYKGWKAAGMDIKSMIDNITIF